MSSGEGGSPSLPETVRLIQGRRSIRVGIEPTRVPHELIRVIVDCGLAAPSSKGAQPWRLHVVTDSVTLGRIADVVITAEELESFVPIDPGTGERRDYESTVVESAEVLRSVPLAIFVENRGVFSGGRRTLVKTKSEDLEEAFLGYSLEVLGLGAAITNMWLAGEALGLHGTLIGDIIISEDEIRELLGMQGDLVGALVLGYSDWRPPSPARRDQDCVVFH